METLLAVPRRGLSNLPGIVRVKLLDADAVLAVLEPGRHPDAYSLVGASHAVPASGVVLKPGAAWTELYLPPGAGAWGEKWDEGSQGESWRQSLTLTLPRPHPDTSEAVRRLSGRRLVAVVLDANNQARLVGLPKQPLRCRVGEASTTATMLTLGCDTRLPAYFLPGYADSAILGTGADFAPATFSFHFKRY